MSIKAKGDIMTFEQALQKAHTLKREGYVLGSILDMGEFWAFNFYDPTPIDADDISYPGEPFITINKHTGANGAFTPAHDFDLFFKAKRIEIK